MKIIRKNIGDKIIINGHLNIITQMTSIAMNLNYDQTVLKYIRNYKSPYFSTIVINDTILKTQPGIIPIGASNTSPISEWDGILYQIEFEIINYTQAETPRPLIYYQEGIVKLGDQVLHGQFNEMIAEILPPEIAVIVTPQLTDTWLGDNNIENLKYIRRI